MVENFYRNILIFRIGVYIVTSLMAIKSGLFYSKINCENYHATYVYFYGTLYALLKHENKMPGHLVDSCKRSNINQMVAGSRLPRSSHGIFLLSSTFQTYFVKLI